MIAKISIKEQPVTLHQFEKLQALVQTVRAKKIDDYYVYKIPEGSTKEDQQQQEFDKQHKECDAIVYSNYGSEHIADIPLLMNTCPWLKFEVVESIMSTQGSTPEVLIHKFYEMSERLNSAVNTFNDRCNVNVGGNTLIAFNRVEVKTDYCTERLQGDLDEGWRIIAVCVQPDGRRPDYVLGKTEI